MNSASSSKTCERVSNSRCAADTDSHASANFFTRAGFDVTDFVRVCRPSGALWCGESPCGGVPGLGA